MFLVFSAFLGVGTLRVNSQLSALALSSSKNSVEGELKNQIFCSPVPFLFALHCSSLSFPNPGRALLLKGRALWAAGQPLCSPVFAWLFFFRPGDPSPSREPWREIALSVQWWLLAVEYKMPWPGPTPAGASMNISLFFVAFSLRPLLT